MFSLTDNQHETWYIDTSDRVFKLWIVEIGFLFYWILNDVFMRRIIINFIKRCQEVKFNICICYNVLFTIELMTKWWSNVCTNIQTTFNLHLENGLNFGFIFEYKRDEKWITKWTKQKINWICSNININEKEKSRSCNMCNLNKTLNRTQNNQNNGTCCYYWNFPFILHPSFGFALWHFMVFSFNIPV